MKQNDGRLQTGEHILAKIIEDKIDDAKTGFVKFEEDHGLVEFSSSQDLRELDLKKLQNEINFVIKRNLPVHISMKNRKEAEKEVNLRKVPDFVQEIRIVDIEGFDKRACKDPHVDNTSQIGNFS
jgi:Ser-tRNA(Ala) deacylase AlaX